MSEIALKIRAMPELTDADIKKATQIAEQTFKPTVQVKMNFNPDTKQFESSMMNIKKIVQENMKPVMDLNFEEAHLQKVKALETAYVTLKTQIRDAYASGNPIILRNQIKSISLQFESLKSIIGETFNKDELKNFEKTFGKLTQENLMENTVVNIKNTGKSLEGLNSRVVEIKGSGERLIRVFQTLSEETGGWKNQRLSVGDNIKGLNTQVANLKTALKSLKDAAGDSTTGDKVNEFIKRLDKISTSAPNARKKIQELKAEVSTLQKEFTNSKTPLDQYKNKIKELYDLKLQLAKAKGNESDAGEITRLQERITLLEGEASAIRENITNTNDLQKAEAYLQDQERASNEEISKFNDELRKQKSLIYNIQQGWQEATARIFNYTSIYNALWKLMQLMKDAITTAKELDAAFNDIQMVTLYSADGMKELANDYKDMAYNLSSSLTAMAQGSSEWLRQGRSLAEVKSLLEASTVMSRVGQLNDTDATTYLTSRGYIIPCSVAQEISYGISLNCWNTLRDNATTT